MKLQRAVFFLMAFLLSTTYPAAGEVIQKLPFAPDKQGAWNARAGNKQFTLTGPDDPHGPRLTVRDLKTKKLCSAELSLVEAVYLYDSRLAVVDQIGGSTTYIDFIDLETCKEKYPGISAYTKGIEVRRDRIIIQPGCEEGGSHIFQCSSASIYALKQAGRPVLLERESAILTQKILGVGFVGTRYVYRPETPEAKFIAATAATWVESVGVRIGEPSVHRVQVGGRELTVNYPADGLFNIYSSLTIADEKTGHACHARKWYIREFYLFPEADVLIYQSYTYFNSFIGFLDVKTCKEKFPRIEFNSYTTEVLRDRIAIPPACEEADRDNQAVRQCAAARIYGFGPGHEPILLERESNTITRQIIGVEFSGYRQVENPHTQKAKLLPQEGWLSSVKKWFSP